MEWSQAIRLESSLKFRGGERVFGGGRVQGGGRLWIGCRFPRLLMPLSFTDGKIPVSPLKRRFHVEVGIISLKVKTNRNPLELW